MSQTLERLADYMDVCTFGELEAHHEDPDGDTDVREGHSIWKFDFTPAFLIVILYCKLYFRLAFLELTTLDWLFIAFFFGSFDYVTLLEMVLARSNILMIIPFLMYTYPNSAFYTEIFNLSYPVEFQQVSGQVTGAVGTG